MAGAAAQSKSSELTDRINNLAIERTHSRRVDEWTWIALKRDVEAYGRAPEFEAESLILMAALWNLRSNIAEMERCLNVYAGKYGKDWRWHRTRAMQGPALGRFDMVTDMLKFGVPEGSARDFGIVAHVCNQSGLFVTAHTNWKKAVQLDENIFDGEEIPYYAHLPSTVAYLQEHRVDERELSSRLAVASQVVIEMSGPLTTFTIDSNDWGITFEFTVDAAIDRLVDIDFAITRRLVAEFQDTLSKHISIGVAPLSESVTDGD
ncbi:hypothetical protein [Pseudomonas auratipiscis]|uniref:Uncharacterized protein n=1 Tax=Pseudomonas auratipiscis TaxID=3115853 RepID=A0AB35WYS6_9PSED|nr:MULTISPECIES: hypothetical protein [unclassified Pseudomonas]MEE1869088.1 hypothetical protein [Pseudomonas sp. 120P]MEE1959735.1 hypothetical protein [Pseudomonas sp. 119P]